MMARGKRTARRTSGLGKRLMSAFLAMVMCISLMQLTVFAEETSAADEPVVTEKVMNGSFVLDKNGNVEETVTGNDHATVIYPEGFTLTKTVAESNRGENEFDVTLQVVTSQTVTTNAAAIQLVIDTSTSMNYCSVCGSSFCYHNADNRMDAVKKVLAKDGGFLDSLVSANTGAIYVSVVTYGLGAKTVCDWTDIKDADDLKAMKSTISNLRTTDNATNMQAGLMLARNRLGMDAVKNAGVKYTVLLTDGYANTYSSDSTSTDFISNGRSPSSASATPDGTNNAKKMAAEVAKLSTLYAVGYGTEKEYLAGIIGNANNTFVGTDSASVAGAFKDIAESAVSGMNGAGTSVTDPMGQFITMGKVSIDGVTGGSDGLTWDLDVKNAQVVPSADGKTTTYIYTITYPITLNTAAKGFEEGKYYPTNGYTYLNVPQLGKQLAFHVPGVSGQVPVEEWTVKYYLQDANSVGTGNPTYTEDTAASVTESVKAWPPVNAPDGYATKYDAANYEFDSSSVTTLEVTPDGENVMRLYYNVKTVTVSGAKTWDDANDADEIRPDSITINLMNGTTKVDSKTVTAADGWAWSFTAPKYDANGNAINYTITEDEVDGYTSTVDGYNVTNTHTPMVTVSGSKTWDDNNNQDGKRPASITINLMNGDAVVESKTVTAADGWAWSFTAPKYYDNGTEIVYAITENPVTDYNTEVKGYSVTNSYSPEIVTVSGSKTWVDNDNAYETRPTSITIRLMNGATEVANKTITAADGWAWSFTGLPRYAAGQEIKYTITEDAVNGYDSSVCGYNVTNTLNNATLTINKRAAGDITEPTGDTAFIVKNAAGETVATVYYKDFKNGSYTIEGLRVGTYTVTEDFDSAQIDGYKLKVDGGPTAKVEVAVGANAYVGFTNHYEQVPYAYKVVHEYYTFLNGSNTPNYVGANEGKEYYAKVAPGAEAVYADQAESEVYQNANYNKGELKDVVVSGNLKKGDLLYTIKYYRSNWTEGALTIQKTITGGLDATAERNLKDALSFVVTAPDGNETEIEYSKFKDGSYTLSELIPGTYTVKEIGAEVGGGYDLTVEASDANDKIDGYQVEVNAGANAVKFEITNTYTSRVYNIWFNGADHGTVMVNNSKVEGVYRNRVLEYSENEEVTWSSTKLPNVTNKTLYQVGDGKIYPNIGMGPEITEEYGYVMYTFTWADYVNYKATQDGVVIYAAGDQEIFDYDLAINAPKLDVNDGWESDGTFYRNGTGTQEPFTGIDAAVEYMNSGAVKPSDGVYNVLYVPKYAEVAEPPVLYGNLTINKTATGAAVPADATFTITDVATGTSVSVIPYADFDNGSYTFKDIPVGSYTVTESGASVSGYSLTTTVDYGAGATVATVAEGETAVVAITNTYSYNGGGNGGGYTLPVVISDEEPPLAELPDEEPPLAELPDEEPPLAELPEEEVPLALAPMTGDTTALYALSALGSAMGLMYLWLTGKKREEDA